MLNYKKFFTLIELVVVVVVLGVLAAIIIPNISSIQEESKQSSLLSDARSVQTAVDSYMIRHDGVPPTVEEASLGNPQVVLFDKLTPSYLLKKPQSSQSKFWLDGNHTVWVSLVDAPTSVEYDSDTQILSWKTVEGAILYRIYSTNAKSLSSVKSNDIRLLSELKEPDIKEARQQMKNLEELSNGTYLVSSLDIFGNESAPIKVGSTYSGYDSVQEDFSPAPEVQEPLYSFEQATFSTAGAKGPTGPSQSLLDEAYMGTQLEGRVSSVNGIQKWTVPKSGTYRFEVSGAQGGGSNGGRGSTVSSEITLSQGEELYILVGQRGGLSSQGLLYSAGGGGGSFVYKDTSSLPLLVAGGGGGQAEKSQGGDGSSTQSATMSSGGSKSAPLSPEGQGGFGGRNVGSLSTGAGGAGWFSDGQDGLTLRHSGGKKGYSPANGGNGGQNSHPNGYSGFFGGFGGGGSNADNTGAGGGGGGYTGGPGGNNYLGSQTWGAGGGAGSYVSGANPTSIGGANQGDGSVTVVFLKSS